MDQVILFIIVVLATYAFDKLILKRIEGKNKEDN
jgi:hypothetical protein